MPPTGSMSAGIVTRSLRHRDLCVPAGVVIFMVFKGPRFATAADLLTNLESTVLVNSSNFTCAFRYYTCYILCKSLVVSNRKFVNI